VLEPARWSLEVIDPATLTSELLDQVADREPALVCIAATPPGGLAHTRYLCKRLRSRFPDLKILVGRWGLRDIGQAPNSTQQAGAGSTAETSNQAGIDPMLASLQEAGADLVATTLLETRQQLSTLLPVLVHGHIDGPNGVGVGRAGNNGSSAGRRAGALEVAASASAP
jgi:hypothetical protein